MPKRLLPNVSGQRGSEQWPPSEKRAAEIKQKAKEEQRRKEANEREKEALKSTIRDAFFY